jgi:DNA gyrase subunit A
MIRKELRELKSTFGEARRTTIGGPDKKLSYSAEDYIIDEDVYVIVTRDGWVKRQRSYTELQNIRIRDGDTIGWVLPGSTRATVCFLTSFGKAYTTRIEQLPSTTGYGDPIQKLFDFSDKEHIVGVAVYDPRVLPSPVAEPDHEPELFENGAAAEDEPDGPYIVAVSTEGQSVRMPIEGFTDPSTKNGRTYMRLGKGHTVVAAEVAAGGENVSLATREGFALIFPVFQIPVFKNAAKGVIAVRLSTKDRVIGFTLSRAARQGLEVETTRGRREIVRTTKFQVSNRGNKGRQVIKRGGISRIIETPIEVVLNGNGKGS